jgi:hypothetical protein
VSSFASAFEIRGRYCPALWGIYNKHHVPTKRASGRTAGSTRAKYLEPVAELTSSRVRKNAGLEISRILANAATAASNFATGS